MSILFHSSSNEHALLQALREHLPDRSVFVRGDDYDPLEITLAVVWQPPEGFFVGLDNLTHVFAIAAGVDQLLTHPGLPKSMPVVRLLDAGMSTLMAEYVLYGVMHAHRRWPALTHARGQRHWHRAISWLPAERVTVGLLGAGTLGDAVARRCIDNGYGVRCWSRSKKTIAGVDSFAGADALADFLAEVNVLVCLLPLTPETRDVLCRSLFEGLPDNSYLINAARGEHLVEADLIAALDSGRLSGALLDVFRTEPLPAEHPFWEDERILITPHVAAPSPVLGSVEQIVDNIRRVERGRSPFGLVDRQLGY